MDRYSSCCYVEPFMGAGAICRDLVSEEFHPHKISINDYDCGIAAFWNSLFFNHEELIEMVKEYVPTVDSFFEFKEYLCDANLSEEPELLVGFRKMALHQISYSGLGVRAGGPIGGLSQGSKYRIDCRWSPDYIIKNINRYHQLFENLEIEHGRCTTFDFAEVIKYHSDKEAIFYLDPPYYVNGKSLYLFYFKEAEHKKLCKTLKDLVQPWILSYDAADEIRSLYKWAYIEEIEVACTINTKNGSQIKREFLIAPKEYKYLIETVTRNEDVLFE